MEMAAVMLALGIGLAAIIWAEGKAELYKAQADKIRKEMETE